MTTLHPYPVLTDSVGQYIHEVLAIPMIDYATEQALGARMLAGRADALDDWTSDAIAARDVGQLVLHHDPTALRTPGPGLVRQKDDGREHAHDGRTLDGPRGTYLHHLRADALDLEEPRIPRDLPRAPETDPEPC